MPSRGTHSAIAATLKSHSRTILNKQSVGAMDRTAASLGTKNRSLRIALADDEGFMRKYLRTVLPRLGHDVVAVAETGRELVEKCRELRPDLVITDVNMPEMDGLEAAAAIYDAQPIPIIVISGYNGPEVIERTVAAHVMAYMVKPIKQSDLEPVIALATRATRV